MFRGQLKNKYNLEKSIFFTNNNINNTKSDSHTLYNTENKKEKKETTNIPVYYNKPEVTNC